jgi:hypothetical protein
MSFTGSLRAPRHVWAAGVGDPGTGGCPCWVGYPHPRLKILWVVYKVNLDMHTRRYGEYVDRHEDEDIYQEEIEVH